MNGLRGKIYVLEGPDRSGKTTLASAFSAALTARGAKCISLSFPGRTPRTLGALVYDIHHSHERALDSLSPTSLQLLHVAAHVDAIESTIIPALKDGTTTVVLDRFWWSTWVYGLASGVSERSLTSMLRIERALWKLWSPTAVFLLSRKSGMAGSAAENRLRVLKRGYETLAHAEERQYPVHKVTNNGSVDATLAVLLKASGILPDASASSRTRPAHQKELPFRAVPIGDIQASYRMFSPAKPTIVFDTYWRFAAERQEIFFRRLASLAPPWTSDPILGRHKFTNPYRASDRVSQYLIRNVIYSERYSPEDLFFRVVLFKFFNKIETWQLLEKTFGEIRYADFSLEKYAQVLSEAHEAGQSIYSAAYIMPTGGKSFPAGPKHRMHLRLLERMMREELPAKVFAAKNMQSVFELLRSYPTIGDFLAYQYATDLNYSDQMNHSENDFVVPGPGAKDGILKCFADRGGLNESELIKVVAERQDEEFRRLGLRFRTLGGRPLQLIDCQNLFCEVDKYSRVKHPEFAGHTGRTRIKQRFESRGPLPAPWYPPKWGVNSRLTQALEGVRPPANTCDSASAPDEEGLPHELVADLPGYQIEEG